MRSKLAESSSGVMLTHRSPITLNTCRRALAFSAFIAVMSGMSACLSPALAMKLYQSAIFLGNAFAVFHWSKMYCKIKRDGPILQEPIKSVAITGVGAKAIAFFVWGMMAALTCAAVAWTAASLMIFPHVHSWIVVAIIAATNAAVWWFALAVWKRFLTELGGPTVAARIRSDANSILREDQGESAQQPVPVGAAHWWTSDAVRDEIQDVGRR